MGRGGTFGQGADERDHLDEDGRIVVPKSRQGAGDGDFAAEFLADFTDNGGGGIFAGLDLAAGEFPFARQMLVRGALGQQQQAGALDHGANDGDGISGRHAGFLNRLLRKPATFPGAWCFSPVNTFLKVLLLAALLVVAVKFSPLLFVGALVGLVVAAVLGVIGVSLITALLAVVLAVAVALSPIWIPVLVVLGLISLFRKSDDRRPPPVAA